jgi:pimeloyl-ACP methyl ester carboxylesterase
MPYADSRGVRIHYELEGDGPPLVLMHSFAGNRTRPKSMSMTADPRPIASALCLAPPGQ